MSISYLNSSYIDEVNNNLDNIRTQDTELSTNINTAQNNASFTNEDLNKTKDETDEANLEFYQNNKFRTSSWMQGLSTRIQYMYDMSGQHALANRIIDGNGEDNKGEFQLLEEKINEIDLDIVESKKINQINEYYEKKRQHQIRIFKRVSYILLVLVLISFLFHMNVVPETVFIGTIGIGIAAIILYLGIVTLDMMFRDNVNYDEHTYVYSGHYLDKSNKNSINKDVPLHAQKDKISSVCVSSLNE